MELQILPTRPGDAAGNMAIDFLLLQRYPDSGAARLRRYGWHRPAFTFGYSQAIADVRARLPADERLDLTRRATGGGLVDHRHDWTYAFVLPRGHPLFDRPGPTIYRTIHEALANALAELGGPVTLARDAPQSPPGVCFERAEIGDIVRRDAPEHKVAGAAMKRGKHAILLQGSIARAAVPELSDWTGLLDKFAHDLGAALNLDAVTVGWPEFNPDEEEALVAQYASPEWIERR